jgi:hypothetical protein
LKISLDYLNFLYILNVLYQILHTLKTYIQISFYFNELNFTTIIE